MNLKIGFDAKRAYHNHTGLGSYARALIKSLEHYHAHNKYYLYTPSRSAHPFSVWADEEKNLNVITPDNLWDKWFTARWRSYTLTNDLIKKNIDVYHGLSNELPFNIKKFKGKKIVTIHDLIFLRYPNLYKLADRKIYDRKFRFAAENADVVIAISEETKKDLVQFYNIQPEKIKVVYQSAGEQFYKHMREEQVSRIRSKFSLPQKFILYVGTIEERKNLLTLVKALTKVKNIPLVVVGRKKEYFTQVENFIKENGLEKRVIFPYEVSNEELPAFYKMADVFIYPSLYEGFGIPILEALMMGTPVITSKSGCFPEAGGPSSVYIDPLDENEIAQKILMLLDSPELCRKMSDDGKIYAERFKPGNIADELSHIYES